MSRQQWGHGFYRGMEAAENYQRWLKSSQDEIKRDYWRWICQHPVQWFWFRLLGFGPRAAAKRQCPKGYAENSSGYYWCQLQRNHLGQCKDYLGYFFDGTDE